MNTLAHSNCIGFFLVFSIAFVVDPLRTRLADFCIVAVDLDLAVFLMSLVAF